MSKENQKTENNTASKALPSSSGSGRAMTTAPTIEEADMIIESLFACAVAHMSRYGKSPFNEDWHPRHRQIWNETIDYQNRRTMANATFIYVDRQNRENTH